MQLALVTIGGVEAFPMLRDNFFSERSRYIAVELFGGKEAQYKPSTDPQDQESLRSSQAHLIGDFFDCLNDVVSRDIFSSIVVGMLAGTSTSEKEAYLSDREFISKPIMEAALNIYLALCPLPSQEIMELVINQFNGRSISQIPLTQELVLNPENGMMGLKKKPADLLATKPDFTVDYGLFWVNPGLRARLEEGWESNVPEVFRDKMKPIPAKFELARTVCQGQGESKLLAILPNLLAKLAQFPLPQHYLPSLFRLIVTLLSYLTTEELRLNAEKYTQFFQQTIESAIDEADKAFKGTPEIAKFHDKIQDLQSLYFKKIARSRTASEAEIQAEVAAKVRAERISSLFEKKKAHAIAKVKKRQSAFYSGTATKAKTLVRKLTDKDDDQTICAVSREPLNSDQTYFQFAFYNHTNVANVLSR
jgi:hypothetical protein